MMKAIIVGLGGRGRGWLKDCREHPEVEVVACVEPFEKNRVRAVNELDVPESALFESLSQALKKVDADFIVDITPPAAHEEIALTAFENGLHVLGEKPMSDSYEACQRIVEAGQRAGVRHMITQNYRFNGLPRTTARLLKEGVIGELGQVSVTLYTPWADIPGSHYVTEPYMFLTDMGIHHFDMMRCMLQTDADRVQAVTWNLPWGWHKGDGCQSIIFRMNNGVIITHQGVACTMGHSLGGCNGLWRFEGSEGTLSWEGNGLWLTKSHRANPKVREELELDQDNTGGTVGLLNEFISSIKDGRDPECSASDNIKSMAMVFASVKSAKEKREVALGEI